jgi:hypothetical protein
MNKKRQRKENKTKNSKTKKDKNSDDDEDNNNYNINNAKKDLFNCVFIFSCILPEYFLMIKNLIQPNFIFESISLNGLTDLIISMREDVGTTLKIENDDENKIFGVFTLIPFNFFKEKNPVVNQILDMLYSKIQNLKKNDIKSSIINILKNKKNSILINERFINLPEELVPPALNFVINEIDECIEIVNDKSNKNISLEEKNKYNLDYIIIYSRYVIKENKEKEDKNNDDINKMDIDDNKYINIVIKENNNKKMKLEKGNDIVYYKYETEYFLKKADYSFDYKLTGGIYDSSCNYINPNNNEIQYMKIIFIKFNKFYEVIHELNYKSFE